VLQSYGALNVSINQTGTGAQATKFAVTGGAQGDTLSGGKGDDTITGGKGADNIYLNAGGTDTVVLANGDTGVTAATADTVYGAAQGDLLKYTNALTLASGAELGAGWTVTAGVATKTGATLADFLAAATAAGTAGSTTGIANKAVGFASGTDLFVFVAGDNASLASDDMLVKFAGNASNTLTASTTIAIA